METINKYLQEGEKILWNQNEVTNWYYIRRKLLIYGNLLYVIIMVIWFIVALDFLLGAAIIMACLIVFTAMGVGFLLSDYKRIKANQLNLIELKHYERLQILTNQRFIRKHFFLNYSISNSTTSLSLFSKQELTQIKDIMFVNLGCIDGIIVDYRRKIIFFIIGKEKIYLDYYWKLIWTHFYLNFEKRGMEELKATFEKIKEILPLELKQNDVKLEMGVYIVKNRKG